MKPGFQNVHSMQSNSQNSLSKEESDSSVEVDAPVEKRVVGTALENNIVDLYY